MPYKSEAQRRYLHAKEPGLAKKWDKKYGGKVRKQAPVEKNYEPIFKADTPGFNHKAAREAYDLVMKMDDDTAEVFVNMVVSEVLEDTISKNLPMLQGQLNKVAKHRMERVRKVLISKAKTDPAWLPYAHAYTMIAKDGPNPYDYGYRFRESDFRRDPGTGRFRTKVVATQVKPLHDKTAASMGLPTRDAAVERASKDKLSEREIAHYQDEYRQLTNFLGAVNASSQNPGDLDVIAHIKDKNTKQVYTNTTTSTRPASTLWDPATENLVGLDARPNALSLGGAYFGLSTALGGGSSQAQVGRSQAITTLDTQMHDFVGDWTRANDRDQYNTNAQTYRRISSGSQLVGEMAPPGSKIQLASRFGQFVGDHGSDAEAVFGPPSRKAAYRYRGTEKTPEKELVHAYEKAINKTKLENDTDPYRHTPEGHRANLKRPADIPPQQMGARRLSSARRSPGWDERGEGRAVVMSHLMSKEKRPKPSLYNLQLASGNTPPSEGVILNKTGQIVTQAVGYGDDHYLPFNLKNLKGLKGGEYIRSRSVGGLTSEDIHTGLMSGARRITVVSRSGTFVLEFEPDFRGGRRHNDKARRMTRRYEQLLDAVQSEQVDKEELPDNVRQGIIDEVREEYPGESALELRQQVDRRIREFKADPELSSKDEKLATFIAARRGLPGTSREDKEVLDEVAGELALLKETKYRLNGVGYAAALEALAEQFPYYIKTDNKPMREGHFAGAKDKGYVEPKRNRPRAASAGLFLNAKETKFQDQGGKFSAADADYQGYKAPPKKGAETTEGTEGAEGEKTENGTKKTGDKLKDAIAEGRRRQGQVEAASSLYDAIRAGGVDYAAFEIMNKDKGEFLARAGEIEGVDEIKEVVKALDDLPPTDKAKLPARVKTALEQYKRASGGADAREFTPELALEWPTRPFTFEGNKAYHDLDTPDQIQLRIREVQNINKRTKSLRYGTELSKLDESQMATEIRDLRNAYRVFKDNPELGDDKADADTRKAIREAFLKDYQPEAVNLMLKGGKAKILDHMQDVHKMRRLKQLGGWNEDQVSHFKGIVPEEQAGDILGRLGDQLKKRDSLKNQVGNLRDFLEKIPSDTDLTPEEERLLEYIEAAEDTGMDQMDPNEVNIALTEVALLGHKAQVSRDKRPWEA